MKNAHIVCGTSSCLTQMCRSNATRVIKGREHFWRKGGGGSVCISCGQNVAETTSVGLRDYDLSPISVHCFTPTFSLRFPSYPRYSLLASTTIITKYTAMVIHW